jgi:hypothetical protein
MQDERYKTMMGIRAEDHRKIHSMPGQFYQASDNTRKSPTCTVRLDPQGQRIHNQRQLRYGTTDLGIKKQVLQDQGYRDCVQIKDQGHQGDRGYREVSKGRGGTETGLEGQGLHWCTTIWIRLLKTRKTAELLCLTIVALENKKNRSMALLTNGRILPQAYVQDQERTGSGTKRIRDRRAKRYRDYGLQAQGW